MAYKYVDKTTILQWVNVQRPFLDESGIPNIIMDNAHSKIDAEIMKLGIVEPPTRSDPYGFLKMACAMFILATLCKAKVIAQTSGELLRERFRDVQIEYQRTNPLFFFATGASRQFMDLLPYETFRMFAYQYLRAYVKWRFYKRTKTRYAVPKIAYDKSSRGAYWNEYNDYADVDDLKHGKHLERDWDYDV